MRQPTVAPFPAEALETNRGGSLTGDQRERLRKFAGLGRSNKVISAVFFVVVGVVLMRTTGRGPNAWTLPWAGAAIILAAAAVGLRALGVGDRLMHDLRDGHVEAIEGAITKFTVAPGGTTTRSTDRYLRVEGRSFRVGPAGYEAAPEAAIVRLYYLPKSTWVVNLERLPDRPIPSGMLDSPIEGMRALAAAVRSGDSTRSAEALATLAALKSAVADTASPPAREQRDPRPLAQAIVGRWNMGELALEFAQGGTITVRSPSGEEAVGRWWVDAEGHLHSDVKGDQQAGEAWVVGDALTLSMNGSRLTFRRA